MSTILLSDTTMSIVPPYFDATSSPYFIRELGAIAFLIHMVKTEGFNPLTAFHYNDPSNPRQLTIKATLRWDFSCPRGLSESTPLPLMCSRIVKRSKADHAGMGTSYSFRSNPDPAAAFDFVGTACQTSPRRTILLVSGRVVSHL